MNEKLIAARRQRSLTQQEICKKIDANERTYQRWESGESRPQPQYLRRLCRLFKRTPEELGYPLTQVGVASVGVIDAENTDFIPTVERDWATWFGLKQAQIATMMNLWRGRAVSCDEVQLMIDQEIKTMDNELQQFQIDEQENISRRQALIAIAALPTTLLTWGATSNTIAEDFISQCAASITACWHLMKGKGLTVVSEVLPKLIPSLGALASRPSRYQQSAAQIATQFSIMQAIISMHQLNFRAREAHCNDAIRYARISGDNKLQAASYMYLGYTFSFCYQPRQPQKAIPAFLQGLQALGDTPSLIKSDILMGVAEAYAQCGDEQKALHYIGLAQEHFPDYPESDQSYIYAECGLTTLYQWEGKMYLELVDHYTDRGYQQRASDALMHSIGATSLNSRCTNETIIYQADAARTLGELDIYTDALRKSAQMAIDLGSKKRYSEALQVYQRTPRAWVKEPQIQLLARDVFKQLPAARKVNQ
jgi:transcriptional regulator with XRE-family HTH domain